MAKYTLIGMYNYYTRIDIHMKMDIQDPVFEWDYLHVNKMKLAVQEQIRRGTGFTAITTHGDIVNLFGLLIMDKKVKAEDVLIVLFDENNNSEEYHYGEDGMIINWAYGFFAMDYTQMP